PSEIHWAAILVLARVSALRSEPAESQLFWQVTVSAPLLLTASFFFGPWLRDPTWITWAGLGFQIIAVVTFAFALWFWLLSMYPAASVAAFGFLSPIFGVAFGWLLLGEALGPEILGALALVAVGLYLINRAPKTP
ncbi:MAG: DMT family transporter, partial [Pseudomonadota bacterium]